jgi:hypothetical protein
MEKSFPGIVERPKLMARIYLILFLNNYIH